MNTAQQIMQIILESTFYNAFKSGCTEDERQLIQSIRMMDDMRIERNQIGSLLCRGRWLLLFRDRIL